MASAVRENFELRSARATACRLTLERAKSPRRRSSGRADALLFLLPAQQARPARLEGFLHVDVSLRKLASPLQDLGVDPVTLEQPLAHAELLKPSDRLLELAVDLRVLAAAVGDAPQPHMRLGDARPLFEALGQLQSLPRHLVRLADLALLDRELAQAQQDVAAAELEVSFVTQCKRALEVAACSGEIATRHQDEGKVVLRPGERDAVAQHLEKSNGAHGVPGRRFDLSDLVIGAAQTAVHPGDSAQVEHGT